MVSPKLMPQATWEFEAEILVLHHPTTISPRYQAMGEWQQGFHLDVVAPIGMDFWLVDFCVWM